MASSQRVWTIIPAAGQSRRFVDKGYTVPKPLLRVRHPNGTTRTMLSHVLEQLPKEHVRIGLPFGYVFGRHSYTIEETRGQADTVYQLLDGIPDNDAVIVSDCDIVLLHKLRYYEYPDVALLVTGTNNPAMSFIDDYPFFSQVVEKEPISEWGIVGVRRFNNAGMLRQALRRALDEIEDEVYLSHAVNFIPGRKVAYDICNAYLDWGTPEALMQSGATI